MSKACPRDSSPPNQLYSTKRTIVAETLKNDTLGEKANTYNKYLYQ